MESSCVIVRAREKEGCVHYARRGDNEKAAYYIRGGCLELELEKNLSLVYSKFLKFKIFF